MNWLNKNKNRVRVAFLVCLIFLLLPHVRGITIESIVEYAPSSILLAALVFAVIYTVKAIVIFIPVTTLYIAAGIVFPTGWALLITYLCLIIALSIGYFIGKTLGEEKIKQTIAKHGKLADFLADERNDNITTLCFIARVLPVPFDLLSMFCGAVSMPYLKYILVSLLGLSPFMVPCVISWSVASNPLSPAFLLPLCISFAVMIMGFLLYRGKTLKKLKLS